MSLGAQAESDPEIPRRERGVSESDFPLLLGPGHMESLGEKELSIFREASILSLVLVGHASSQGTGDLTQKHKGMSGLCGPDPQLPSFPV